MNHQGNVREFHIVWRVVTPVVTKLSKEILDFNCLVTFAAARSQENGNRCMFHDVAAATSKKWIEAKMKELGVTTNADYKLCMLLDDLAMITVDTPNYGVIEACTSCRLRGSFKIWPLRRIWTFSGAKLLQYVFHLSQTVVVSKQTAGTAADAFIAP